MLDLGCDHMLASCRNIANESKDCQIVRFSSAAGKDQFRGRATEFRRDCRAPSFETLTRDLAGAVGARGVAVNVAQSFRESFGNFRRNRSGRIVIEVQQRESIQF